jgi:hypothetical protein
MTPAEMKARLEEIEAEESQLRSERDRLTLAIEEAEGRPDSLEARFARAAMARDHAAMTRLCAEGRTAFRRKHGSWPQQEIEDEAQRLFTEERS